ncbi:lipoprotein [Spiroplasma endosymbiont of Cantharis lateralis]|uniref:lipoprotein n=1 Tax=Spiroplasma endosymbiont of Cantharis lateralis TaxID=3066277 RepID=UPI00313BBFF9
MKKLLTLFTAITLFASTSTSVISCQSEKKFELPDQPKSGDDIVEALDKYRYEQERVNEIWAKEIDECNECSEDQEKEIQLNSDAWQKSRIYEAFIRAFKSYKMLQLKYEALESKTSEITYSIVNTDYFDEFIEWWQKDETLNNNTKEYMLEIQKWAKQEAIHE